MDHVTTSISPMTAIQAENRSHKLACDLTYITTIKPHENLIIMAVGLMPKEMVQTFLRERSHCHSLLAH